jgi:hypothetical protein
MAALVHHFRDWYSSVGSPECFRGWQGEYLNGYLTSQQRGEAPAPPQPEGQRCYTSHESGALGRNNPVGPGKGQCGAAPLSRSHRGKFTK